MKICIYSDVHFSEYSSIIRKEGLKYSIRLEYMIKSINWAEEEAINNNCDLIICLGDFFNKPDLNSREITALKDIKWANIPHNFLVGNHEASVKSLKYNSVKALESHNFKIISQPYLEISSNCNLLYIPYILDSERLSLKEYWDNFNIIRDSKKKQIVLSHNDIKGIDYGSFESKEGFDIKDIESNCDIFINGHLHNGLKFCKNGINIGNLTGQNFSEDASKYSHELFILDTDNNCISSIENPYAFNFYKISILKNSDLIALSNNDFKNNSLISVRCDSELITDVKNKLDTFNNILSYKIISVNNSSKISSNNDMSCTLTSDLDHLGKFIDFCHSRLENSKELEDELSLICNN